MADAALIADAVSALLRGIADLYRGEGRAGADDLAAALDAASAQPLPQLEAPEDIPGHLAAELGAALAASGHPVARAAEAAGMALPWTVIRAVGVETVPYYLVLELIGPQGMIPSDRVAAGLYVQERGRYYRLHAHAAEETYVTLGGTAMWTAGDQPPRCRGAGAWIHHPPWCPHATRTGAEPLLAAWRWSGDLRAETYRYLEEPA